MRSHIGVELAAALLVAGTPVIAHADTAMSWGFELITDSRHSARLAYGAPETDNVDIILECRRHSGRIVVTTFGEMARSGVVAKVTAGGVTTPHRSKVEDNEAASGVLIETPASTRDPAISEFRRGAVLTVTAGRNVTRVPPVGPGAAEPFFQFCG